MRLGSGLQEIMVANVVPERNPEGRFHDPHCFDAKSGLKLPRKARKIMKNGEGRIGYPIHDFSGPSLLFSRSKIDHFKDPGRFLAGLSSTDC